MEIGKSANNSQIVFVGISVGVADYHYVLTLCVVNSANKAFAINGYTNILTEQYFTCEDITVCGITVKVFVETCGCGSFLPIIVGIYTFLGILCNYLVKTFSSKVGYKLFRVARFVINVI